MIEPGTYVRDKLTGFEGYVTAYIQHLTGCDSYWATSPTEKDDKGESVQRHYDEMRWEILADKAPLKVYDRRWWMSEKVVNLTTEANRKANPSTPPG